MVLLHQTYLTFHVMEIKVSTKIRLLFQVFTLCIFTFQALQSFNRFFSYPVVIQTSEASINTIQKPAYFICQKTRYNYAESNKEGYSMHSKFLAGLNDNSPRPTWKGKHGNSSFQNLIWTFFENNFKNVEVNIDADLEKVFLFYQGFCLKIESSPTEEFLEISTTDIPLRVYPSHESTETNVTNEKSDHYGITIDVGAVNSSDFHIIIYEVSYEVHDNTLFEGETCIDYRKQTESYGDCLYEAVRKHIYSIYKCYPPWLLNIDEKECEKDIETLGVDNGRYNKIWSELDFLTDGNHINVMKDCMKPCYTITVNLAEKTHIKNFKGHSYARIIDNAGMVTVYTAAYSFDIFALIVELGSALGLWLGKISLRCDS